MKRSLSAATSAGSTTQPCRIVGTLSGTERDGGLGNGRVATKAIPANASPQMNAGQNAALANRNASIVRRKSEDAAMSAWPELKEKREANATPTAIAANGIINGSRARKPFSLI